MVTFITGDRSASPVYTPLVAIEMMRALNIDSDIVTGGAEGGGGVNALVAEFAEAADVTISAEEREEGESWDAFHERVLAKWTPERVIAIHVDPHSSSVVRSLLGLTSDDQLRLVTTADLF